MRRVGSTRPRVAAVLSAALLTSAAFSWAAANPADTDAKLRQLMTQARQPASAASAARAVAAISPERLKQKAQLLITGEAALARIDLNAALQAFDQAASIQHAADTEMALVRTYLQGGQYRRALASGAHTAGAHLDVVAGSALYAWLLNAGGQTAVGQRLLDEAEARIPNHLLVRSVQQQWRSGLPLATDVLLNLPTRLAPYSSGAALPAKARVAGSGVLLAGGQHALVPLALLPAKAEAIWVRNGLGQTVPVRLSTRLPQAGVALLQLGAALPVADDVWVATNEAFPGSAGFALEYTPAPTAQAAWPVLRSGFVGGVPPKPASADDRLLGIDMPPGPRGGPVFDAGGRLIGLALAGPQAPLLVTARVLRRELARVAPAVPAALGPPPPADLQSRKPVDAIYETALKTTLQLITLQIIPPQ